MFVLKNFVQKLLQTGVLRITEKLVGRSLLLNLSLIHK